MSERELLLLVETLTKQVQNCLDGLDKLRVLYSDLENKLQQTYVTKEYARTMEQDTDRLEKKLDEVAKLIVNSQEKKFKQTIALQGAILLAILGAVASYVVPLLFQTFFHH